MALEGILARMYIIMIGTRGGREARMHVVGYLFDVFYGNISWQNAVQTIGELWGVKLFAFPVEVGSHLSGVYSRICSSCTHNLHVAS